MTKKILAAFILILFFVSAGFAGQGKEVVISEGLLSQGDPSVENFTSSSDAMFDRAHMCSTTDSDCSIPRSYTTGQPKFHMRFWAPASQDYTRHYLIADSAGTLLHYYVTTSYISSGWGTRSYEPPSMSSGDYIYTVIWQGTDGRAAIKSYNFAVR